MPTNWNLQNMLWSPFSFFINKKLAKFLKLLIFAYISLKIGYFDLCYDYLPHKVKTQMWYFGHFWIFAWKDTKMGGKTIFYNYFQKVDFSGKKYKCSMCKMHQQHNNINCTLKGIGGEGPLGPMI